MRLTPKRKKRVRTGRARPVNGIAGKFPTIKKAKYRVGEKVYSYQNPTVKMPIAEVQALIDDNTPMNRYRLLLKTESGKPKFGNWISELSIYTIKKPSKSKK
jgi:hypothetical protein